MKLKRTENYQLTIYASYVGYITQAVVNNFSPLLFLKFAADFGLSLDRITLITTLNFFVQLLVDLLSAKLIDRIGYRACIMAAHFFSGVGLVGLAVFPNLLGDPFAGILLSVILYAIGGGMIEVMISPIVEACPTEKKEAAMSLLHSFYCWGHVGVVLLSTLFFRLAGIDHWRIMACLWALIPLANMIIFYFVPIYPIISEDQEKLPTGRLLASRAFWTLFLLMVCAGASEQAMSQWASAFAESGLHISKTFGDLLGPCAFAICMGTARALYGHNSDRIPLRKMMIGSAALCIACYNLAIFARSPLPGLAGCAVCGFSVGIFWPGTFSMASAAIPGGGTEMFALLALAGDVGCSLGPTVVGFVANANGGNLHMGLIPGVIFPVVILICLSLKRY